MTPVSIEERRHRVEVLGSRRRRDQVAVAEDDARLLRERLGEITLTPASQLAWFTALFALRTWVPPSTFEMWIRPLRVAGARGGTLYLDAPDKIRSWVERRYSALIGEALERASGGQFTAVSFAGVAPCR